MVPAGKVTASMTLARKSIWKAVEGGEKNWNMWWFMNMWWFYKSGMHHSVSFYIVRIMLSNLYKPFTVRILSYVTSQKKIEDS